MDTSWTPDKMITRQRVYSVAISLFSDEFHDSDCKSEEGHIGEPCSVCAEQNAIWKGKLTAVRRAMFVAFGHDPDQYPEITSDS